MTYTSISKRAFGTLAVAGALVAVPLTMSTGTASAATHNWDGVAQCESGGDWNINTGNGYYGGLLVLAEHLDRQRWHRLARQRFQGRADPRRREHPAEPGPRRMARLRPASDRRERACSRRSSRRSAGSRRRGTRSCSRHRDPGRAQARRTAGLRHRS
ncbi:transglycosylase family protein [Rhodococcus qingshengii]